MRSVLPMLAVLFIGVFLITYFPPLTTFLPRLLKVAASYGVEWNRFTRQSSAFIRLIYLMI